MSEGENLAQRVHPITAFAIYERLYFNHRRTQTSALGDLPVTLLSWLERPSCFCSAKSAEQKCLR